MRTIEKTKAAAQVVFQPVADRDGMPSLVWKGASTIRMIGFVGFVAACFISARRFKSLWQQGRVYYSLVTGIFFLAAFVGLASGSKGPVSAIFVIAVVVSFAWITAISVHLKGELRKRVKTHG